MTNSLLCPSMMCCDFANLVNEIKSLDLAGCDIFHCDIMDGNYVANMALSPYDVKVIKEHTSKMVDVHLMVSNPDLATDIFLNIGVDLIYIHPFTSKFPLRLISKIKEANRKCGIVINPHEPLSMFKELLPLVDYVMVMTVNPGFAGQKYITAVDNKINELLAIRHDHNFKIVIDGACSMDVITSKHPLGVDGFVLGTSVLFNQKESYLDIITNIKQKLK